MVSLLGVTIIRHVCAFTMTRSHEKEESRSCSSSRTFWQSWIPIISSPCNEFALKNNFLSPPPRGGLDLVTNRQVPSNRRLQRPPGRTGSLARGSYNNNFVEALPKAARRARVATRLNNAANSESQEGRSLLASGNVRLTTPSRIVYLITLADTAACQLHAVRWQSRCSGCEGQKAWWTKSEYSFTERKIWTILITYAHRLL